MNTLFTSSASLRLAESRLAFISGAAVATLAFAASPAWSQNAAPASVSPPSVTPAAPAEPSQEIVVTGSRIRGVAPVGSNLVALNHDEIVASGTESASDLLRKVPQVLGLGPSATSTSAQNGAANATRASGVNLRGLGVNATLLLMDGRRFPAAGTQGQYIDPSVIPFIALDRVEVVADGASAIYGSDAVAGVVNLILRKNFEGMEANARADFADGYNSHQFSGLFGHHWDSGSFMVALEHTYNTALDANDRNFYTSNLLSRGGKDYRSNQCSPGNIVVGGVSYAIPTGGVTAANVGSLVPGTTNLCDNLKYNYIIPEQQKNSAVFSARQDVNSNITLFGEGFYSKREVVNRSLQTASLSVPSTNPFYVRPIGAAAGTSETVNYSFLNDIGASYTPSTSQSFQLTTGADIRLPFDWKGQVSAGYGRSDDISKARNNYYTAGGAAELASTSVTSAFNPFGAANTAAAIAGIRNGEFIIQARTGLIDLNAQADGPLYTLPGGQIRLAVGGEYRQESLVTNLFGGSTSNQTTAFSDAVRQVRSAYGELFVPIFGAGNSLPLMQKLNVSIAGRYDEYSDFGSTTNPKVGLTWQPVNDLVVRSSYGKSFRAPSLIENSPVGGGAGLYGDTLPCATGTCYGIGIAGGNTGLKPETAETWSVGGDYHPSFLPGLKASLTYFHIDYANQIVALRGTTGLLTLPYYAAYRIFNPTPAQIAAVEAQYPSNTVINNSQVTYIQDGRRQNLGTSEVGGLDFDVSYNWMTGYGQFNAGVTGEYFTQFKSSAVPGTVLVNVDNTINNPQTFRSRGEVDWSKGDFSAFVAVNYVNAYNNNTVTPVQRVDAYTTVDLHLSYRLGDYTPYPMLKGVTVSIDAQNLFDEDPPFVNISGGYDSQSANPIGRLVGFNVDKKW